MAKEREPLKLIPLDDLKKVVAQIVNAPKEKVERIKAETKRKSIKP
jgi:vacuolar-type H+-ATPase subunit E/Vma4